MNRLPYLLALVACMTIVVACESDNAEEEFPTDPCDLSEISYSTDVVPLLDMHCTGCHNTATPQGNLALDNYNAVRASALNADNQFAFSLRAISPFQLMPLGGPQLPECDIRVFEDWIDAGAPNN